jgi:hypothetical protein
LTAKPRGDDVLRLMGVAGGNMSMTREELTALRDAIDTVLTWTAAVRAEIARWLTPQAAKPGNGLDPRPPIASTPKLVKPRRVVKPNGARAVERRLLTAMRETPGLTVIALANASRSAIGERLRQLAECGVVEKSASGRWRLKDDPPDPPPAGEASRPPSPPSS